MMNTRRIFIILLGMALLCASTEGWAQGTAFTYQGRLNANSGPANGNYDFRFRLASDALGDNYVGPTLLSNSVPVSDGLFTVTLSFGDGIFTNTNLWLEIDVRTNGVGSYTTLAPLQPLTPTPYSITAENAATLTGTLPAGQLTGVLPSSLLGGTYSSPLSLLNSANQFNGTFSGHFLGDGSGLTNVALLNSNQTFTGQNIFMQGIGIGNPAPLWAIDALAAQAVGRFVTTNSGNGSVIELMNAVSNSTPEYLGAINFNNLSDTTPGQIGYISADSTNQNQDYMSFRVGGGISLQLLGDSRGYGIGSILGGFYGNSIVPIGNGGNAIVGGGYYGIPNTILSNSPGSIIGAGSLNTIGPNANDSFIGGGYNNLIGSNAAFSAIPGGYYNSVSAPYSLAAGVGAQVNHQGSLVLADGQFFYFSSERTNEFAVRAQNGMHLVADGGIHLNAADRPMIVRDWDVFGTNAPSYKEGIGRWGLFMEPSILTLGIPADDVPGRYFQVAKYDTNGNYSTLMYVDQSGNVSANNYYGYGGNLSGLTGSQLSGILPGFMLFGTYSNAVSLTNTGNRFAGDGSGLINVNASSLGGIPASGYAALNSSPTFTGTLTSSSLVTSNAQVTGLLRSGSEIGTSEIPSPAGLVIRRVNSINQTSNQVVAVARTQGSVTNITLVRDGTAAGFQIQYPASPGLLTVACMGIDNTGAPKNFYATVGNPGTSGTIQVYSNAQNVVHFECTFGITFNSGQHLTQVSLSRYGTDYFWSGTLTSTYNQ